MPGNAQCGHDGARPYRLIMSRGRFAPAPTWYWNFWHREEAERGLDATEDLLTPGIFAAELSPQAPVYLMATAESAAPAPARKCSRLCQAGFADN